jgi:dTDP-4-dehydrorhamnose reductase
MAQEVMRACEALGLPAARIAAIKSADWPTRVRRPLNSALDSGKFERDFGLRLPDWRESVRDVVKRLAAQG